MQPQRERIDVHIHLVEGESGVESLLAALDRAGITRAVVMASPHLDPGHPQPAGSEPLAGWREANDRLLEQTRGERARLLPFITVDPAQVEGEELDAWLAAGACGVKLYLGHHSLHPRPLADPAHHALFTALERGHIPVLAHVNTYRYEAELDALLAAFPELELVCPHFCGARTDIGRLERILAKHPNLLVDTSHGPGRPGVEGFTNIEAEAERVRALIAAEPQRFLYGSDLVTSTVMGDASATRFEWDRQLSANLGMLEAEHFEFFRVEGDKGALQWGEYRGLALRDEVLQPVLAGNAARWLERCVDAKR